MLLKLSQAMPRHGFNVRKLQPSSRKVFPAHSRRQILNSEYEVLYNSTNPFNEVVDINIIFLFLLKFVEPLILLYSDCNSIQITDVMC